MLKIRMMCLYVLLAGNVTAADIMNGLFDQVSGLLVHRAADVIARDLEANLPLINKARMDSHEEVVCDSLLHIKILKKNGKRLFLTEEVSSASVQQEDEPFRIQSFLWDICQNIKRGDTKTLLKVAIVVLAGHGTIRIFT